jgi:CRISPR/Cas system-associated exonuclease Cas4 (RecB family)
VIAGNFSFKNLKEGLIVVSKNIKRKKEVIKITTDVIDEVEELLHNIITKIMTEDFVQTPELSRCVYCDYKDICNR